MSEQIRTKEEITPAAVAALAERAGIVMEPDRVDGIAQRLSELFDLSAPLQDVAFEDLEVTQPFDPRWKKGQTPPGRGRWPAGPEGEKA